jgi:hypothetical protein
MKYERKFKTPSVKTEGALLFPDLDFPTRPSSSFQPNASSWPRQSVSVRLLTDAVSCHRSYLLACHVCDDYPEGLR